MDNQRAVRQGDPIQCTCCCKFMCPCPNGKVLFGAKKTFINNRLAARQGDTTTNCCGGCCKCPNKITTGSKKTIIENRPAARKGDKVSCGFFLFASTNTFIG
jgi:uncharacterized Zn-binding protein involved in type VI secretion